MARQALKVMLIFSLPLIALDLFFKWWVQSSLPLIGWTYPFYPYGGRGVFKDFFGMQFAIVHATNKGAAWGTLQQWQTPLLILRIVIVVYLLYYLFFKNKQRGHIIPLAMILAGAIGNVVDYFIFGHVIDMFCFHIKSYSFPIFNIADASIFLGVVSLLLQSFFSHRPRSGFRA